eukprot:CAMPEP_0184290672 /NCGR_PEP_ID=MMETSP1049-20130417/2848_1 /TAXON_ID=77928 /ORGANISM="Proteomonas sulcata, Strain CCMP704" /LENGTH=170 /DNA_ID=CAMNT_0026597873 /DNA_START=375 /DNA_END=887 /DNA_ORIENTATION=-
MTDKADAPEDPMGLLNARKGMNTITAQLWYNGNAEKAVKLYQEAFKAKLMGDIYKTSDGLVFNAVLSVGDTSLMLADSTSERTQGPRDHTTCSFYLYCKDCDTLCELARRAGMEVKEEPADQFYGDRTCTLKDPFGHQWTLATPLSKQLSREEVDSGRDEFEKDQKRPKT